MSSANNLVSRTTTNSGSGAPVTGLKKPAFSVHDMSKTFIDLNKSYVYVGDNSRFQQRITWILSFQWIFYSMLVMISPIMFRQPKFECSYGEEGEYVDCTEESVCLIQETGVGKYNLLHTGESIASQFHLICGESYLINVAQSIIFGGYFISGLVSSWLSDRIGRRKSFLFSIIVGSIATVGIGFSNDIYMVMGLTFLAGFGMNGYELIILVYCTEISERRFRDISVTVLSIMWALSQVIQPTISTLLKEWRLIYIYAIGLPLLLSIAFTYRFFCESPRYLASKKRYYEAREVFRYISEQNKRPPYEFHLYEEIEDYNSIVTQLKNSNQNASARGVNNNNNNNNYTTFQNSNNTKNNQVANSSGVSGDLQRSTNMLDLFKSWQIASITFIMCYFWFMRYFAYFILLFSIDTFGTQIQKNFTLLAIIEVVAALISMPLMLRMKRKQALRVSIIMMTVFSFLLSLIKVPKECLLSEDYCLSEEAAIFFAILLKFGTIFFIVNLMTYTSQIFPTVLRSQGQGICMIVGSIGSTSAPLIKLTDFNPLMLLAAIGALGLLMTLGLDENDNMRDFIERDHLRTPLIANNNNNNNNNNTSATATQGQPEIQLQNVVIRSD